LLLAQVATVFAPPVGQSETVQQLVPVEAIHVPLFEQNFCPVVQVPLQAAFCAMQVPLQFCGRLLGQVWTHAVPLQLTLPLAGTWQATVHSLNPQVARAVLLTQVPLQLW
jgi:hypothetical protein